ncbi:MAG TPA: HAD-IA family hydrolase [Burkholderiaceae bacterium]|nr:HAD-IA family hydrolase [Burkholderiaceae bacterium]
MSLTTFKVLTFDVVGTLIDFEGGMLAYLRTVAPDSRLSDDDFLVAYRNSRKSDQSGWYPDDLERVWHEIAPPLGLPDSPAIAQGLRDSVAHWPAFPDSVEALKRLRKHYKLVSMTNAQRWALAHFEKTLDHPFDMPLSCDDALCEKPDPQYFAYARGRYEGAWGCTQDGNLHVAQSQYHDIGVAKSLGIATCWVERRHGQKGSGGTIASAHAQPDYHVRTLGELADAVDAAFKAAGR